MLLTAVLNPLRWLMGRGPGLTRAALGMSVAHVGLALCVLGITVTSSFGIATDQSLVPGGKAQIGDYEIFSKVPNR